MNWKKFLAVAGVLVLFSFLTATIYVVTREKSLESRSRAIVEGEAYGAQDTVVFIKNGQQNLAQSLIDIGGQDAWGRSCPISDTEGILWGECSGWTHVDLRVTRKSEEYEDVVGDWIKAEGTEGNRFSEGVVCDEDPNIVYVGSRGKGVWKSSDGGESFSQTGLSDSFSYSVVIKPESECQTVYTITWSSETGVQMTDNGGQNWSRLRNESSENESHGNYLAWIQGDLYWAGLYQDQGLVLKYNFSEHAWQGWGFVGKDVLFLKEKGGAVYAGVYEGGMWRRFLDGEDWEKISDDSLFGDNTVWSLELYEDFIWASTGDRGLMMMDVREGEWRRILGEEGGRSYMVYKVPDEDKLYAQYANFSQVSQEKDGDLWESDDLGQNWEKVSEVPAGLMFIWDGPGKVFAGTVDGVWERKIEEEGLACPQGLEADCTSYGGETATFSWNAVEGADQYALRINEYPYDDWFKEGSDQFLLRDGTSNTENINCGINYTWSVQGVKPGEEYPYAGCGQDSSEFSCGCEEFEPKSCYQGLCPLDGDNSVYCQTGLECQSVPSTPILPAGWGYCVNPGCPTDEDCVCDIEPLICNSPCAYDLGTGEPECPEGLVCQCVEDPCPTMGGICVNPECPNIPPENDCVCVSGDYNQDGTVSLEDYNDFLTDFIANYGEAGDGDYNGDGVVSLEDYNDFLTDFIANYG